MRAIRHWTSAELAHFPPDDGKRYEIIDGELSVHQPTVGHQIVGFRVAAALDRWNSANHPGEIVMAPGVIFDEHNDVAPVACDRVLARVTKRNLGGAELFFMLLEEIETARNEGDKE